MFGVFFGPTHLPKNKLIANISLFRRHPPGIMLAFLLAALAGGSATAQYPVSIHWDDVVKVSRTTPTLQVVVNPMLERGSPIHDSSFRALRQLGAEYVRFVPWFPYPHMAVAELKAPTATRTFWDFSKIDPLVDDFMKATAGHAVILNFSTIPDWMFRTEKPVAYPADPGQVFWSYNQGTRLRDTTLKELTGYFVRLFSWYTRGGFTDELGVYHRSGHHYRIPYWEVLNEPDLEHDMSPQRYTRIYDAVVHALKKISPQTKFVALALAYETNPEWFTYFLDPAHHTLGVRPEGISYHFYGSPHDRSRGPENYGYAFFDQANAFLDRVRYVEHIKKRLAPHTFTTIDEIGNILGDQTGKDIPAAYWNLSGAMYAYVYAALARIGIDMAGESQLVGYPTQFPSVSMMDWKDGRPNSRYQVLRLLKDNFGPGDTLVATGCGTGDVAAQAFMTAAGRKLLLINKRDKKITVSVPGFAGARARTVDVATGENPPASFTARGDSIALAPFAVTVVGWRR
jgi:hypothetical protein